MSIAIQIQDATFDKSDARQLSAFERLCLLVGIVEIPLQLDKYFMFHEHDASLGAVGGLNVSLTTLAIAILYWLWLGGAAIQRQGFHLRFNFGVPMLIYILAVAVSTASASVPMLSIFDVFLLAQAYLLFFYLANRVQHRSDLLFCITCLAITILTQSFFIFGLAAMGESAVGQVYQIGPIDLAVWEDGRPTGTMNSAVLAGSTLAIMWLPCTTISVVDASKNVKMICGFAIVFGLLAIFLTQTRGAILSSALGATLIGIGLLSRNWLPKWTIPATIFLSLICALPLYNVIKKRVQGDDSGSASARLHLSAIAMEMIQDRPFLGSGAGNCHITGQRYADQAKYRAEWYYTIHCKYLLVWIETGLFGLVTFLSVLAMGIRQGLATWFTRQKNLAPIGLALAAAIVGHMLHMFVDVFNSRTQVQILWVILGLSAAAWRLAQSELQMYEQAWEGGISHAS